jgi:Cytochrome C'
MLDDMDTRAPVPLVPMMANHQKQNMRDHLLAVQEITTALATKDFAAIEKSSARIGYSEQMGQMCTHMGAGAPGFTDAAVEFHHTADTIADAAKKQDADAVLSALNRTLATCTSCHAKFKQRVVDEATWSSLTQQKVPSGPPHH